VEGFEMNIGETIRRIRKSKKMTLKQLSEMAGITISFLSDLENSKRLPSIDTLKNISVSLDTPLYSLFIETTDSYTETEADKMQSVQADIFNMPPSHEKFILQAKALFMSDELSREDKDAIFKDISDLYWAAKGYKTK
jgi:transcriptional regulator with XRE-family HTH domain